MNFPVLISYFDRGYKVDLVPSVNAFPVDRSFRILLENANEVQLYAIRSYIASQSPYEGEDLPF